uniref:LAGLIDADG endonuclease n=2 Tax=Ophiocordyceps sinensis TaxID=72228 RepID=A0A1W5SY14_9HYPO|nr:LAGLIDADG endonuclease [Ophiocordyceps sinensis]ARF03426.1 LAGLIDADG endonuclease [Ophiocordyceps sinensis]
MVNKWRLFNRNFHYYSNHRDNETNNITITKVKSSDNNPNNDDVMPEYTKIFIENPFNNRKFILKVAKKTFSCSLRTPRPNNLDPYWVTGFCDAEGCFGFRVRKNPELKTGASQRSDSLFLYKPAY